MKSMRSAAFALILLCLRAQSVLTPDLEALTQIRTRMLYNLKHQPNYTCLETIERSSRPKLSVKLKVVDTLHLEVALVDGRELFGWPGSKKFEDSDITQLVPTGAIGNGTFGTHAQALFGTRAATFHFRGTEVFQGKRAIRFDYQVPQMLSRYSVGVGSVSAMVGYHGSFYADPSTYDVKRIDVVADDLPPQLMLASTEDKIDYAVARIGEADFLLPAQSEMSMVGLNGGEEHNFVKFSSCREFTGQSTISFEDPTKSDAAAIPVREFDLPQGLTVELATTKEIDIQTAAIGDAVVARVSHDVKQKGEIVLPKGATATGRITRLEKYDTFSILGIEFSEIEGPGILARMNGTMADVTGLIGPRHLIRPRRPKAPKEGLIQINTTQRHLFKGCIMIWRT